MRTTRILFGAATVLALFSARVEAADLIVNGDMGLFGGPPTNDPAIPNGWYRAEPGVVVAQSSANSPFTNKYANNASSWNWTDDATLGTEGIRQDYSAGNPLYTIDVNFDFRLASLTDKPWGVQYDNVGAGASAVHFRIDTAEGSASHQFAINQTGAAAGFLNVTTLEAGKWYNVQARLSDPNASIVGSITPEGGAAIPFSASMLPTHNKFTSLLIRDRNAGQSGDLTVDNFSVIDAEPWRVADFNEDGHVTVGDLGILATHFNETTAAGKSVGDANRDGVVSVGDLGILATYFNQPDAGAVSFDEALKSFPALATAAVPEPTAAIGLIGMASMAFARRRRI